MSLISIPVSSYFNKNTLKIIDNYPNLRFKISSKKDGLPDEEFFESFVDVVPNKITQVDFMEIKEIIKDLNALFANMCKEYLEYLSSKHSISTKASKIRSLKSSFNGYFLYQNCRILVYKGNVGLIIRDFNFPEMEELNVLQFKKTIDYIIQRAMQIEQLDSNTYKFSSIINNILYGSDLQNVKAIEEIACVSGKDSKQFSDFKELALQYHLVYTELAQFKISKEKTSDDTIYHTLPVKQNINQQIVTRNFLNSSQNPDTSPDNDSHSQSSESDHKELIQKQNIELQDNELQQQDSDSEDDEFFDLSLEEEPEEEYKSEEKSEEDKSEENKSEEDKSEEDKPEENNSEEEYYFENTDKDEESEEEEISDNDFKTMTRTDYRYICNGRFQILKKSKYLDQLKEYDRNITINKRDTYYHIYLRYEPSFYEDVISFMEKILQLLINANAVLQSFKIISKQNNTAKKTVIYAVENEDDLDNILKRLKNLEAENIHLQTNIHNLEEARNVLKMKNKKRTSEKILDCNVKSKKQRICLSD